MPETPDRSQICCESHGLAVFRKVAAITDLTLTRVGTLGAYALEALTEDQIRALHRKVKNTRKPNGRPPIVR